MKRLLILSTLLILYSCQEPNQKIAVRVDSTYKITDSSSYLKLNSTTIDTAGNKYKGVYITPDRKIIIAYFGSGPLGDIIFHPEYRIVHSDCLNKYAVIYLWEDTTNGVTHHHVDLLGYINGNIKQPIILGCFGYEARYDAVDDCEKIIKDHISTGQKKYKMLDSEISDSKECFDYKLN